MVNELPLITPDTQVALTENTLAAKMNDQTVLLSMTEGTYFGLNEVASTVWNALGSPRTVRELCAVVSEEYEVSEEQCFADVSGLLRDLAKHGLVRF